MDAIESRHCDTCGHFHRPGDSASCAHFFVLGRLGQPQPQKKPDLTDDGCCGLDWQTFFGPRSSGVEAQKLKRARPDLYAALRKKAVEAEVLV